MRHVLLIPADDTLPVEVHQLDELNWDLMPTLAFGDPTYAFNFITFRKSQFQILVDDIGLLRTPRPPMNRRALVLAMKHGYNPTSVFVGNVLIIGCDSLGEWSDVPADIILSVA